MIFYRYETIQFASTDGESEYYKSQLPNPKLVVRKYDLLKETPKGYWIGFGLPDIFPIDLSNTWKKWVSKTSRKKYAYPTEQEALINFIKRSEIRAKILRHQLHSCEIGINLAKNLKLENINETN